MLLGSLLTRHGRYRPRHTALVFGDLRVDFAALDERVDRVAQALGALGLAAGDRVATMLGNRVELLEIY
jgi:long-chain acyl-CoA synthetase